MANGNLNKTKKKREQNYNSMKVYDF
jgi:hypothetical protein